MEENQFSNIYIQTEGAWEKEGQNKFGYTGPKPKSMEKRKQDSHEQHSYLKKIVTAFKIFTTFYDLVYKEFDEIIKLFLYKPEIIEELEKHYNCKFIYGRRLSQYKIKNGGGTEFIKIEGLETLYNFIEHEFKHIGLKVERYTEEDIQVMNETTRLKVAKLEATKERERNELLVIFREIMKKKELEKKKKPIARGIQQDILNLNYFKYNDIGTLILPCGIGKSILSLFLNDQVKSNKTIIGVPSLNLVGQFRKECLKFMDKENILCIGSNYETKRLVIRDFFKKNNTVIITTYHSAKKILEEGGEFDFKIGDECHHLVGEKFKPSKDEIKEISDFKKFLEIKSKKSLFMTATPKFIQEYNDKKGTSMDNEKIFGKVIYRESVKWAIENNYITDYYLEVIRNTENELDNIIDDIGINVDHKELFFSALMSLKSLERNPKLTHLLIYTNTTESADIVEFYIKQILDKNIISIPNENIYHRSLHSKVKDFNIEKEKKAFIKSEYGIISCVQIFGEGVDIPKLNGVVVAEHMESEIRIVQSLLRPHRLEKGNSNKEAFIICPFIDNSNELNNKSFDKVKQIVKHMRNCDDQISSKINLTEFKKRPDPRNPKPNILPELVEGDGTNLKILKTRLRKAKCLASELSEEEEDYLLSQEINKANNIISKQEYLEDRDRVLFIENPEGYFKKHALWKGWYDFLGIETKNFIQTKDEWIRFCKEKNVKSVDMYNILCEEYSQLPREPSELYLGFTNICNELGLFSRRR